MCNAADFWGEFCALLPIITSVCLRVAHLARPKFHQHLIRRETPIEAADEAIIDGAWVYGMVRAANFPLGRDIHQLSPPGSWISLTAPLVCEIHLDVSTNLGRCSPGGAIIAAGRRYI